MEGYVIRNKKTGEAPKGRQNRVYPTERGAKMGLNAAIENILQREWLYSKTLDYSDYLGWWDRKGTSTGFGDFLISGQTESGMQAVQDRYLELKEEWKIQPASVELGSKVKMYMCKTDYDHELVVSDGVTLYPSEEAVREHKKCTSECGIVCVTIELSEVVQKSDFSEIRRGHRNSKD